MTLLLTGQRGVSKPIYTSSALDAQTSPSLEDDLGSSSDSASSIVMADGPAFRPGDDAQGLKGHGDKPQTQIWSPYGQFCTGFVYQLVVFLVAILVVFRDILSFILSIIFFFLQI